MRKRILVTGASGFVGSHVLRVFRDVFATAEILGVGRRASLNIPRNISYATLDLTDSIAVTRQITNFRPTTVVHLAAESSILRADKSRFDTWRANFGALFNLTDAIEQTGVSCQFMFVSSSEVYGAAFTDRCPVTEQTEPQPMNAYAHSKWLGEQLLLRSTTGTCVKPVVMRPFNHIGPGQDLAFAVASFSHQIALIEACQRPPFVEVGNLSAQRDFLDVADVVDAYVAVLKHDSIFERPEIFNVCSGQPRSLESVLITLRELSKVPFEIRSDPTRTRRSDIPVAYGDSRHLQQVTGWSPKIDGLTSLARILDDARVRVATAGA